MRLPALVCFIWVVGCFSTFAQMNSPYPASEDGEEIYYDSFSLRPKHLDPARSYSASEYRFIAQIYEPVVQYHYLKRPYQLIPLSADGMPICRYFDKDGNELTSADPPAVDVARAVYTIRIKKGILYQKHPCFAKDASGKYLYHELKESDMGGIRTLFDFKQTGTRELKAKDYVLQILRLADMRLSCPIFGSVVSTNIDGMEEYSRDYNMKVRAIRTKRRKEGGILYNQEEDEKTNPIRVDYFGAHCSGVRIIDDYTYQVVLKKKYPQFIYWLAMPFFAPMPQEALDFYEQGPNIERNINLDWYPVGTGAYRFAEYNPHHRIVLVKNENYRNEPYPSAGAEGDKEAGLLDDAGKPLPLISKFVFSKEKETSAIWIKFLQGYYDASGIQSENFSEVMDLGSSEARLSPDVEKRGLKLITSVSTSVMYMGFNMLDSDIGGLDEKQCKLRQAISIVIDQEEYLQIFRNNRGLVAQSPIPPGIFGYIPGRDGVNPYTHVWDAAAGKPKRRSVEDAKKLMTEAGYPNGMKNGKRLALFYDCTRADQPYFEWLKGRFDLIGITLEIRQTDYNRFQEKMMQGKSQIFSWGWNADYPDPENFLFLLYGPGGKVKNHGENSSNYENEEFDKLYLQMKTMANSPKRAVIINKMVGILQHDAPWQFGYYPKSFFLSHSWIKNRKPNLMANNNLKYLRMDVAKRSEYRAKYNKPRLWALAVVLAVIVVIIVPGVYMVLRKELN